MPSVLFEVRSSKMRSHPGEVSFAGGKMDSSDRSLFDTAARETAEELGVKVEQIEYLGRFAEPEVSYGGLVVWPFLAYIHSSGVTNEGLDDPLAALDVTRLRLSSNEVQNVLALPFSSLKELGENRLRKSSFTGSANSSVNAESIRSWLGLKQRLFRNRVPYDVVDVSDVPVIYPASDSGITHATEDALRHSHWGPSMATESAEEDVEIWGLTGLFLNVFLRRFGIWEDVGRSRAEAEETQETNKAAL
ncbi:hypothetical protein QFC19_008303 [Naganishia cerealis]|uniref:Uncharacterized protein n=1 Tax=Naganishia cerealis TaxID=610337 RepID=A0ACC2V310_9TREE|nr:hypothetical protein QFC19_008303 [Naganishia cerealis]